MARRRRQLGLVRTAPSRAKGKLGWVVFAGATAAGALALWWFFIRSVPPKSMPMTLDSTKEGFARRVWNAIDNAAAYLSTPARNLLIAHAAYESGWGKARPYKEGNNLFNITRLPTDTRPVIVSGDSECTPDGDCKPITQRFAAYPTLEESVTDYLAFISKPRYTNARQLLEQGDMAFLAPLYKGGYFTLPLAKYQTNMESVLGSVQHITGTWTHSLPA